MKRKIFNWRFFALGGLLSLIFIVPVACKTSEAAVRPAEAIIHAPAIRNKISGAKEDISTVGFACRKSAPEDLEIERMVDEVIAQTLGKDSLKTLVHPGDRVVIKVNLVGPNIGKQGEKGLAVISDARIVRHLADKIREIIGFEGNADLKVADACYNDDPNPSKLDNKQGFAFARAEKPVGSPVAYDSDGDGYLDGPSKAKLVNLDSLKEKNRKAVDVTLASGKVVRTVLPKFLQKKADAVAGEDYCDVLIGVPVWKSHALLGITGALKLHYGFRPFLIFSGDIEGDTGRFKHSGLNWDAGGVHDRQKLIDYLCAEHLFRAYDFVVMDALAGNRRGPRNPTAGLSSANENEPVDLIHSYSVLASTDPVALDTAATLYAGYSLDSIGILKTAQENGLGSSEPAKIRIIGQDNFCNQRQNLSDSYAPQKKYPFENGWGGAKIAPSILKKPEIQGSGSPEKIQAGVYRIALRIIAVNEIARIEFVSGDKVVSADLTGNPESGKVLLKLPDLAGKEAEYRLAIWDKSLNCTMTELKKYQF